MQKISSYQIQIHSERKAACLCICSVKKCRFHFFLFLFQNVGIMTKETGGRYSDSIYCSAKSTNLEFDLDNLLFNINKPFITWFKFVITHTTFNRKQAGFLCFSCLLHLNFWSEIRCVFFFRIMYPFQYAILIVYLRLCQYLNLIVIDAKFPSVAIKTKRTKNKAYFTEKLYSRLPATHW